MHLDYYSGKPRVITRAMALEQRFADPTAEIAHGLDDGQFLEESGRCLSCGLCMGCGNCWMYCNARSYEPTNCPQPGAYFEFDPNDCEGCAKCIELCPCGYLSKRT
jgi:ferredoxin